MEGIGKMTWSSGKYYHGNFKADKKHGKGVMSFPNGRIVEGEWREGHFQKAPGSQQESNPELIMPRPVV